MTKLIIFGLLLITSTVAWSGTPYSGLQVDVARDGSQYTLTASFDTPLTKCAAYHYLTDYEAAKQLPGVIESLAYRESVNKVRVERTADEQVLFFHVRLHSVMEYTEQPFDRIEFTQLTGDSKTFQGNWLIEPNPQGSTLKFQGLWEPDTLIPLFIIDHFAKNGLIDRFSAIARLAEKRKDMLSASCIAEEIAESGKYSDALAPDRMNSQPR
jgi:Polyketide cyclase / dehydrase and lipid transport